MEYNTFNSDIYVPKRNNNKYIIIIIFLLICFCYYICSTIIFISLLRGKGKKSSNIINYTTGNRIDIKDLLPNLSPPHNGKYSAAEAVQMGFKNEQFDCKNRDANDTDCIVHINKLRKKYMKNPTEITLRVDQQKCADSEAKQNAEHLNNQPHTAFTCCGEHAQGMSTGQSCICAVNGFLTECVGLTAEECVKKGVHGSPLMEPTISQIGFGTNDDNDITVNYYYDKSTMTKDSMCRAAVAPNTGCIKGCN